MVQTSIKHDCKEELRSLDLKATPTRLAILQFLEKTDIPLDVSTLITYLEKHHIDADPATVFRIMNMFTEKGLVKQISFHEGKFRYELASKPDHHHLICMTCGKVEDFSDCAIDTLEKDIKKKKEFTVISHSLEFFGTCKSCRKRSL